MFVSAAAGEWKCGCSAVETLKLYPMISMFKDGLKINYIMNKNVIMVLDCDMKSNLLQLSF